MNASMESNMPTGAGEGAPNPQPQQGLAGGGPGGAANVGGGESAGGGASGGRAGTGQLSHEQILDATAACLAEYGYDGTTIRRIAGKLGCAVGSIYRYCADKRTLLSQVAQRRYEPVLEAVEDVQPLQKTVGLYAQAAAGEPQQYRLMFWLAGLGSGSHPGRPLPVVVAKIIDGWSRQVGDPRHAQRLWAQLHGGLMLGLPVETILADLGDLMEARPGGRRAAESDQGAGQQGEAQESDQASARPGSRSGQGIAVGSRDRSDMNML